MASRRSSADRVLESRHLIGLFLGVVLLCGVFFTLGYVMGRTQYGGAVHAESPTPAHEAAAAAANSTSSGTQGAAANASPEWDFYTKKPDGPVKMSPAAAEKTVAVSQPVSKTVDADPVLTAPVVPTPAANSKSHAAPPHIGKGSILLQVAALSHQSDAMAMASLLQQKRFPAFVSPPSNGDKLYRVQVGPYSSESMADAAKGALDHDGFKAIIKR